MSIALSATQSPLLPQQQPLSEDWKQEITERLDRYRAHRPHSAAQPASPTRTAVDSKATKIARAVASRYAAAPTYSELLAQEAARAEVMAAEQQSARQAKEAAEIEASRNLFQELDPEIHDQPSPKNSVESPDSSIGAAGQSDVATGNMPPGTAVMPQLAARTKEMWLHQPQPEPEPSLEDLLASALVESRSVLPSKLIEFPRELISPHRARPRLPENPTREQFQEPPAQLRIFEVQPQVELRSEAPEGIPSDTETTTSASPVVQTEVPRSAGEVAPPPSGTQNAIANQSAGPVRSAMPTTRESQNGPGRSYSTNGTQGHQAPSRTSGSVAAHSSTRADGPSANASIGNNFRGLEWASISLDKEPIASKRQAQPAVADYMPFMVDPASIDRRVMAFAVDFAAVTAGFLGFLTVFVASTPHLPTGMAATALAAAVYIALWVMYQMLFFSLSGATAGMLYAHIALCTFDDQNPTRSALQRRLIAWWMSLLPLGIGFLWCFVDEDNLCWHDRIARIYQREY